MQSPQDGAARHWVRNSQKPSVAGEQSDGESGGTRHRACAQKQASEVLPGSERENQIAYINAYMWNLEKWYR